MPSSLAALVSPFVDMLGLPKGKQEKNNAGAPADSKSPLREAARAAVEKVDLDAISQATAAAVSAERLRWAEVMAVGLSVGMGAYAVHLAKSDMSAKDAISKLQKAKADTDKTAPRKPQPQDAWLAEKARQAAEGRPTPMQIHADRIRQINAQGNQK
ncbi:hypothetical protein [Caballeronia grimmiae]|uniref:hypothetical protein n=1 Tax=Caballeronia grimmiae TaxID=1071679 RepID=UPI0038B8E144